SGIDCVAGGYGYINKLVSTVPSLLLPYISHSVNRRYFAALLVYTANMLPCASLLYIVVINTAGPGPATFVYALFSNLFPSGSYMKTILSLVAFTIFFTFP